MSSLCDHRAMGLAAAASASASAAVAAASANFKSSELDSVKGKVHIVPSRNFKINDLRRLRIVKYS